jgi:archaellum biogenesis ATPase FlaH
MSQPNYSIEVQKLFLSFMISDPSLFVRVRNIVNPEYFNPALRKGVEFLMEYSDQYNSIPSYDQFKTMAGLEIDSNQQDYLEHQEWFLDTFGTFSKHKAIEKAIMDSADDLEEGNYGSIEERIKDAVLVGLNQNIGIDYFANPEERLNALKDNNGMISTGWKSLDHRLYGGFNRGELEIFAAPSGGGKSVFLQNLAVNAAMQGLNTIYITLELAENLVGKRIDSMITGTASDSIYKDIENVDLKVRAFHKKYKGSLQILYAPSGSSSNDLKASLREYQIQTGRILDVICVDYLDLCSPNDKRVSPSDLFVKDKYVSEELRNIAKETNTVMITASQLNRSAVESVEYDHAHISGGISKINTSDNLLGIFNTAPMREKGKIQLQLLKTRNSGGVGSRVDLAYDISTLRITDLSDEEQAKAQDEYKSNSESIYDNLKAKKGTSGGPKVPEDSLKKGNELRNLVNRLQQ